MTTSSNASGPPPPLVIGCHHKTGTNLLLRLLRLRGPGAEKLGFRSFASGRSEDRKLPLSMVLKAHPGLHGYVNCWFEHEIDVSADSIRLLHFVRHPVKWVRSAYLYHKKGAPSDKVRWLDWRVFRLHGDPVSYSELLNRLDMKRGLAIEAVRSYPEIAGTARAARTSSRLNFRHRISLEQVHEDFDRTLARLLGFMGLDDAEAVRMVEDFKHHDLSRRASAELPDNVTRSSPDSAELEGILAEDPLFSTLYAGPGEDMGFERSVTPRQSNSILPQEVVAALVEGRQHLLTSCYLAQMSDQFMRQAGSEAWWMAYGLQFLGGGHLMMQRFIQEMVDARGNDRGTNTLPTG